MMHQWTLPISEYLLLIQETMALFLDATNDYIGSSLHNHGFILSRVLE